MGNPSLGCGPDLDVAVQYVTQSWNSDGDDEALHSKSVMNKLFSILIEVILPMQVCQEYQPIKCTLK